MVFDVVVDEVSEFSGGVFNVGSVGRDGEFLEEFVKDFDGLSVFGRYDDGWL